MAVVTKASTAALFFLWGGALQPQIHSTVDAVNPQKRGVTLTTECKTDGSSAHYEETLRWKAMDEARSQLTGTVRPQLSSSLPEVLHS